MEIEKAISFLDNKIVNSNIKLSEEIFLFLTRSTPMINVDLLIKDEKKRSLLAWRDDEYTGKGWHIPGGIVRYKETLIDRVKKVAETEIGLPIDFEPEPIAINEIILKQRNRGHFISLLYRCYLESDDLPSNKKLLEFQPGYLKWHEHCPENLIKVHEIYKEFI